MPYAELHARHEELMGIYRTAEQELEEQRVLMAELADRLSRGLSRE